MKAWKIDAKNIRRIGTKLASKVAKEMFEAAQNQLTQINGLGVHHTAGEDYAPKSSFSRDLAVQVTSAMNTADACLQHLIEHINSAVENEQKKTIWVLSNETL